MQNPSLFFPAFISTFFSTLSNRSTVQKCFLSLVISIVGCASLTAPLLAAEAYQQSATVYDDEFGKQTLNPRWSWLNEDANRWRINALQGKLLIDATSGDVAVDCNNAQNVLLQDAPSGPFEISTKVEIEPTEDFQQAGIIIMNNTGSGADQDNYVKLDIVYSSFDGGKVTEFVWEEEGLLPDDGWWVLEIEESDPAYLRMTYNDGTFTGYFSSDGENWKKVGSHPFELSADAQIGLFAVNGVFAFGDDATCTPEVAEVRARFDYFRVAAAESVSSSSANRQSQATEETTETEEVTEETSEEAVDQEIPAQEEADSDDGNYITQTLDGISYESTCTYVDRTFVDGVRIGEVSYVGAYDVWADCDSGLPQGVVMLTPDNETVLYVLLSTELTAVDDVSGFETALAEQLSQRVSFSGEGDEEREEVAVASTPADTPTLVPTATQQATATIIPTATPQPTATRAQPVAVVQVATLNLRGGPGTNYNRIGSAPQNSSLTVTGQVENCAWLQVTAPTGETAWVSGGSQFVRLVGDCATIPVAQAPAPPAASQSSGGSSGGGADASKGCFLFVNQLGPEITITFTNRDNNNNKTTKVPSDGQIQECYDPGRYTYTLDAPPPWGSTNGEVELAPGDYFRFPISGR